MNTRFFRNLAIGGNALFILWITYNAIDEGFKGTFPEKVSFLALVCLLALNIVLIVRKNVNTEKL